MQKGALKLLAPATITFALVFTLATLLRLGVSFIFSAPSVLAHHTPSPTPEPCGNVTTYVKYNDFSDSRVNINFDSDYQIDVSAQSGYQIIDVWLEVDGIIVSGYDLHFTGPLNDYNPNPGGEIEEVKVNVKKVCASPSPSPSPSLSPEPSPSEEPFPSPEPTPTPSVDGGVGGPVGAPVCTNTTPTAPTLNNATSAGANSILVRWSKVAGATHYSIFYGSSSGNYIYSVPDTGDVDNYVINGLGSGCFAVKAVNSCAPGPLSNEICTGRVLGATNVLGASTLGATGTFADNIVTLGYLLGFLLTGSGIMKYASKRAKK